MLTWFEQDAPIRQKFRTLLLALAGLTGLCTLATVAAACGWGTTGPVVLALACWAAVVVVMRVAGRLICDPYVNTVVRMEGLAGGDLASPIAYTDHRDCVGRMTKAMAVFRDNARTIEEQAAAQNRVVSAMQKGLEHLASNDLSAKITEEFPPEYEQLRLDYNRAVDSLSHAIGEVARVAGDIRIGSGEIRLASEDLAGRTERQASSIERTTTAMTEVNGTVRKSADDARQMNLTVNEVHGDANEGGKVVERAMTAMNAISQSAREISQIIGVIDGIAFQTNLLALNAGVEAARAGDAGKGFAVVANEVRALAQRSAEAAHQIKTLIQNSNELVDAGVGLVDETGAALGTIVERIGDVRGRVESIAEISVYQATSLDQIGTTMTEMDRMTQQNAAMVEESTAAARNLAAQADQLADLVGIFRTGTGTGTGTGLGSGKGSHGMASAAPAPRRVPSVSGNLALATDDWSEF